MSKESFVGYPLTEFLDRHSFNRVAERLARDIDSPGGARRTRANIETSPILDVEERFDATGTVEAVEQVERDDVTNISPGGTHGDAGAATQSASEVFDATSRLLEGVYLAQFASTPTGEGRFVYDIALNSEKVVGFRLQNPKDTIIAFGKKRTESPTSPTDQRTPAQTQLSVDVHTIDRMIQRLEQIGRIATTRETSRRMADEIAQTSPGKTERPNAINDFHVRLFVNEKNQLDTLQIYGKTIRVYFSKGLVAPVRRDGNNFILTGDRQRVDLGEKVITVSRNRAPKLSGVLVFGENLVRIGGKKNVVARLGKVRLGGTFENPRMVFDDVELV